MSTARIADLTLHLVSISSILWPCHIPQLASYPSSFAPKAVFRSSIIVTNLRMDGAKLTSVACLLHDLPIRGSERTSFPHPPLLPKDQAYLHFPTLGKHLLRRLFAFVSTQCKTSDSEQVPTPCMPHPKILVLAPTRLTADFRRSCRGSTIRALDRRFGWEDLCHQSHDVFCLLSKYFVLG